MKRTASVKEHEWAVFTKKGRHPEQTDPPRRSHDNIYDDMVEGKYSVHLTDSMEDLLGGSN